MGSPRCRQPKSEKSFRRPFSKGLGIVERDSRAADSRSRKKVFAGLFQKAGASWSGLPALKTAEAGKKVFAGLFQKAEASWSGIPALQTAEAGKKFSQAFFKRPGHRGAGSPR